ncbi:type VI secretion system tip protein TssI/VgrG [Halomonas sp. M1]|nr:type VI secretion system tip protein TssI/VgrG [Halomonas sp. M1]
MVDKTGLQFTLTLPGVDDTAVVRFTHREALSEPFTLSVDFASRTHDLSPTDCLDQEATLSIWQDGEPLRRVHGIIAELHRSDRGHRRSFYRVEIRPALWRLSLRHNSRIFQDTSLYDAITTLASERRLTDIGFATTRTPLDREFLVQYRETDLAFIERVAAEEGCFYFHEFENAEGGKHSLVFADSTVVLPSVGERVYHGRAGGTPPRRHVRKLRQVSRVRPASAMLKDYTFKNPAYAQIHEHQAPGLGEHAQREDYEHFDYPGRYKKDASGKPFTRHLLESLRADATTAEAESDLPELAPGICFTLTDHDIDSLNQAWQVVSVVHHGEQPQALEEDGMARGNNGSSLPSGELMTRYHNDVVIMPKDQTFRPIPNPKPRVDGPQVAFVVGPEGEEIYCDEHGRVKVQFPWDRYAEPNETASCWVRVAQDWAGGGYGSLAIPRIGHEVIVSFLEGDPDQPLVTGRTYHAVNTPPYPLPKHKTRTVIRTQSHKAEGFNELRFEDEAGEEHIWLHAQKDLELLTLNDRTEEIRRDSHLKLHRNRLSEIHNDDHLTVHGKRFEHIEGAQHLSVEGTMHMRAGQAWLSESGQELHIKSGQKAVLEADGEITLKAGGSFIKLDASGITIVGPKVLVNAGGSPGNGSGQATELPRRAGEAALEVSDDVTLEPHQDPLFESAAIAAATWVASQDEVGQEEDDYNANIESKEKAPIESESVAVLREKAQRWQCRQGQIAAARQKANRLPEHSDQRASLLATTERFERDNLAVEHARLAQHIYEPSQPVPVGWENVSTDEDFLADIELTKEQLNPDDGDFRAGMYTSNPDVFGNAFEPALVFKGTTSREDWLNNFAQGADRHSDYYERAVELGDLIQRSGAKIHITGHSLGGGMASAASRASGMAATTFNAAGLHPNTVERYGGTLHILEQENIAAYRVRGEVLTNLQEQNSGLAIPSLAGWGQQQLAKKLPNATGIPHELPGHGISRIDRHSMTQVIDGLEAEKAFDQRHLAEATGHHCQ